MRGTVIVTRPEIGLQIKIKDVNFWALLKINNLLIRKISLYFSSINSTMYQLKNPC